MIKRISILILATLALASCGSTQHHRQTSVRLALPFGTSVRPTPTLSGSFVAGGTVVVDHGQTPSTQRVFWFMCKPPKSCVEYVPAGHRTSITLPRSLAGASLRIFVISTTGAQAASPKSPVIKKK